MYLCRGVKIVLAVWRRYETFCSDSTLFLSFSAFYCTFHVVSMEVSIIKTANNELKYIINYVSPQMTGVNGMSTLHIKAKVKLIMVVYTVQIAFAFIPTS